MRHNKKDRCESDCEDQEKIRDSARIAWKRTALTAVLFFWQSLNLEKAVNHRDPKVGALSDGAQS